jgi:hypothetical protein
MEKFQEFEEAVEEYGKACADLISAYEWGVGGRAAEAYKKERYDEIIRIAKEMIEERFQDGIQCSNES